MRKYGVGITFAAAATSGALLAGCTPGEQAPVIPSATPHFTEKVAHPTCIEPQVLLSEATRLACQQLRTGRIALVDFGEQGSGYSYNPNKVAAVAATALNVASDGYINLKPTVIPASPGAIKVFKKEAKRTPEGLCVNTSRPKKLLSFIAKTEMPQLKQYNLVTAIGSQACRGKEDLAGGIAAPKKGIADVYANSDRGAILISGRSHSDTIAVDLEHELGHLFGLGHSGTLYTNNYFGGPLRTDKVNIGHLLRHATYDEYADANNIMSNLVFDVTSRQRNTLNDMQRDYLEQSSVETGSMHGIGLLEAGDKASIRKFDSGGMTYASVGLTNFNVLPKKLRFFDALNFLYGNDGTTRKAVPVVEAWLTSPFSYDDFTEVEVVSVRAAKTPITFRLGGLVVDARTINNRLQLQLVKN